MDLHTLLSDKMTDSLAGAFFGAGAALVVNGLSDRYTRWRQESAVINRTVQLNCANMEMLGVFRNSLLTLAGPPLDGFIAYVGKFAFPYDADEMAREWQQHDALFNALMKEGLMKRHWEPVRLMPIDFESIAFVADEMPEIIRSVLFAQGTTDSFFERVAFRTTLWEEAAKKNLIEKTPPDRAYMFFLYQMLDNYRTMAGLIDRALIMLHGINILLLAYHRKHYAWGKTMPYSLAPAFRAIMPPPDGYRNMFGESWALVQKKWLD